MLALVPPQIGHFTSYMDFVGEMLANGDTMWTNLPAEGEPPGDFIERILGRINPLPGGVPESSYWGLVNDEVVGRIALRHDLNDSLREFGGHIGYEVKPSWRRRGIATLMLQELLRRPETMHIGKLLVTCAPDNIGSNQTIRSCGGVLVKTAWVEKWKRETNYYWIDLECSRFDGRVRRPARH